jgi:hypothetical protein
MICAHRCLGHPVTKTVAQIMRPDIGEFGCLGELFYNIAKGTL